jgi:hypothetical protein
VDPLAPLTTRGLAFAVAGTLALFGLTGYGWARAATDGGVRAFALAPATGAGALLLGGVLGDRLGVGPSGRGGAIAITAAVAFTGYAVAFAIRRSARRAPELPSTP